MSDVNNPLQNISYTSRDFQTIYPELLEMVKKLSAKWDPSASNESDPGNVLIKLAAVLADKNSYNIDKNVLECFPLSVTQEKNARQLYQQLGYRMNLYKAASSNLTLQFIGDLPTSEDVSWEFKIPEFTMFSNDDNSIVYTSTKEVFLSAGNYNMENGKRPLTTVDVLQGTIDTYSVNGNEIVTLNNLDSNNRLYLPYRDIAENGIFIRNRNSLENWERVDTLSTAILGDSYKVFEFDLDPISDTYYIEFPDNIGDLIGEGLSIKYIRTLGRQGNVVSYEITKFFNNITDHYNIKTATGSVESDDTVELNTDNVKIFNPSAILNGEDPEDLNSAYRKYKKTIGTFETLVTLLDYNNYLTTKVVNDNLISNGFVSDRTNDPQYSFDVMTYDVKANRNVSVNQVEEIEVNEESKKALNAFDLKMYVLKPISGTYDESFDLIDSQIKINEVIDRLYNSKSIQHDFESIFNDGKICMFRNRYSINCKIIPQYSMTDAQVESITNNVVSTLWEKYDAKSVEFGEEITYDSVYDTIMNSDDRIQYIILDNLEYATFAVYWDATDSKFKEVCISDGYGDLYVEGTGDEGNFAPKDSTFGKNTNYQYINEKNHVYIYNKTNDSYSLYSNKIPEFRSEIYAKSVLAGKTQLLDVKKDINISLQQSVDAYLSNIEKVTTQVTIPASDVAATDGYTLRENESILFYRANYINDAVYANYVRYQCNFSASKGDDHALSTDEKLIFYWRKNDDDNYSYQTFVSGDIINASFNLVSNIEGTGQPTDFYVDFNTKTSGVTTVGQTENVYKNLAGTAYNLSGTKQIATRKKNEVKLSGVNGGKNYCYWVLNNAVDGKYVLFTENEISELNNNPSVTQLSHILQANEYFMYTNESGSFGLAIQGSGTEIILKKSSNQSLDVREWSVPKADYSNVSYEGKSALSDDNWFIINGNKEDVSLQEMLIYSFGQGSSIRTSTALSEDITNVTKSIPATTEIYYKEDDSADTWSKLPEGIDNWNCRSMLNLNVSPEIPQLLQSNQTITTTDINGETGEIEGGETPKYVLSNYRLYVDGGEDIDTVKIDSRENKTYLQLYSYTEQPTGTGYNYINNKVIVEGASSVTIPVNLPVGNYLIPISLSSGSIDSIKISSLSGDLTIEHPSISLNPDIAEGVTDTVYFDTVYPIRTPKYLSIGQNSINLSNYQLGNELPWNLQGTPFDFEKIIITDGSIYSTTTIYYKKGSGKINTSGNIALAYYSKPDVSQDLEEISGSDIDIKDKKYYYLLAIDVAEERELEISGTSFNAIIYPICTINNYATLKDGVSIQSKAFDKLIEIDTNHLYDYSYIVEKSNEIENPLDAASFNDTNHIFNKNTICMIGKTYTETEQNKDITSGIKLNILNRIK